MNPPRTSVQFELPTAPDASAPLLLGFSGGLDSSVLLHRLATSRHTDADKPRGDGLRAIHVHHGLHPDADAWAAHCRQACEALGVPLEIVRVRVDRDAGDGPEAAARRARHAAFAQALQAGEALVLAHHRDDQAETFLLRALRASGTDGLASMRGWRAFGTGWLWRPLLAIPRSTLLAYAQAHGLRWIEDGSNRDLDADRNFLRHRVLPLLRERWPRADAAFARSAGLCADAAGLLEAEDARWLAQCRTADPRVLSATALARLPVARRARVLRRWIDGLGLPPLPAEGIKRIEADLLRARPDADAAFAWAHAAIRRWRDLLHAAMRRDPLADDYEAAWDGQAPLPLPTGDVLVLEGCDAFEAVCRVHARRGGERITLPGRTHSHALKHVLQELGVPPWERERLPLLSDHAGRLLAAGDLVLADDFDRWLRARGARLAWRAD